MVIFRAFSTVVADTQFSVLGVALLALLARVSSLITIEEEQTEHLSSSPSSNIIELKRFGGGNGDISSPAAATDATSSKIEDLGEVLRRPRNEENPMTQESTLSSSSAAIAATDEASKLDDNTGKRSADAEEKSVVQKHEKKKKKRKQNAIDDIFSGL